jgi:hypothetical protein
MIVAVELLAVGAVDRIGRITSVVREERRWKERP